MPIIEQGPLSGLYRPDYDGGSIVNLMASIINARGGHSPHAELACLPSDRIRPYRKVLYLVLDGLGINQLEAFKKQHPNSVFFGTREYQPISSVFPATTAAAVTTFARGASPAEHAILSWYLFLPDLGVISTILLQTSYLDQPLAPPDFPMAAYLNVPSYMSTVPAPSEMLTYDYIVDSRFSNLDTHWKKRTAFKTLRQMEEKISAFAEDPDMRLGYAYWPQYDSECHAWGCDATSPMRHLVEIDAGLSRLAKRLRDTDTLLLVTADHGLIDAPLAHRVNLAAIPGLYDCLTILPSGDSREVSCFVRPARVAQFLDVVQTHLAEACICIAGEELIASGVYGPGAPHAALAQRIGDYVLISRGNYAFSYPSRGFEAAFNVGNHGGMSATEVQIPLFVISPGDKP